jgi:outer membrane lipoprotein-sorting protein
MKKLLLIVFSFSAIQFAMAQYDPEAKSILDAMSAKYRKVSAFSASFSQKLSNESAGLDESMDGTITVKQDKYKLEIAGQEIYNNGESVWSFNKEAEEVTVSDYEPDDSEISLNNIWDLYQDGFKYILLSTNQNGNRVIDLDPVDRNKTYYKIRMIISGSDELFSFTVYEKTGNQYKYQILNFTERPELNDAFFTFNPSDFPGVEVIDFRG